jgi:signal transduction histidine kinase
MRLLARFSPALIRAMMPRSDAEAQFSLVRWLYAGRICIAVLATFVVANPLGSPHHDLAKAIDSPVGLLLLGALILTAFAAWHALRVWVMKGVMPPAWHLRVGALLDVAWLVLAYIGSGYNALPYAILIVLWFGLHSVLIGPTFMVGLGVATGVVVGLAQVLGLATSSVQPLQAQSQAALLIGVGLLSAVFGNRIRAAGMRTHRMHGAIQTLTAHYHNILNELPVGVVVLSDRGHVLFASTGARDIMGEAADITASSIERRLDEIIPALHEQGPAFGECVIPRSGKNRHIQWSAEPATVPDLDQVAGAALLAPPSDGAPGGHAHARPAPMLSVRVVTLVDVTDQIERADLRAQAGRFAAIAELSAGLAHEARNPIAAMRSAAEQLAELSLVDESDRRLLGVLVRESDRLSALVTDFLAFSRVGGGRPGRHMLRHLVHDAESVVLQHASARQVRLDVQVPDVEIVADADLIHRALTNLMLNAVEFSPQGEVVEIRGVVADGEASISIHDRGPGVPDEVRPRIFAPFYTTRASGSGLGLAIAQRSAVMLHGYLTLENSDSGALFRLRFPIAPRFAS